jgi:aspartate racemase
MKTIGLIGGMSWESSSEYYRLINELVKERLGGLHSAKSVMVSVDFAEVEILQSEGRWDEASQIMVSAARSLEKAGADFVILCTNTMHKLAGAIQENIQIPFLHIADATAARIQSVHIQSVGLLGTRFTMEEDFYKGRLADLHGLNVIIPTKPEREMVHRIIYDELCAGVIDPVSRGEYRSVMGNLAKKGARGIVLGCTEIGLLVSQEDSSLPLFDTTRIHAEAAVDLALS